MAFISLKNIQMAYSKTAKPILNNYNFEIEEGELVSLLGPSGCGKTTTLRILAGLLEPTQGTVYLQNEDITHLPVHKRNFGMVFQSYALFPHLSVFDNIAFGLKLRHLPKETIQEKVSHMIEVCGLSNLGNRLPKELSGGQRQRVALARALVIEPQLLLLDEPLSNLDAKLRLQMRVEIRRIQQALKITTLFVTHDQEECFSISDKVAIMNKGIIEQYGTPEEIYSQPKNHYVANFIGFENFLPIHHDQGKVLLSNGLPLSLNHQDSSKTMVTIRPDHIDIVDSPLENTLSGTILVKTFLGKEYQYRVKTEVGELIVNHKVNLDLTHTDQCLLYLPKEKLLLV